MENKYFLDKVAIKIIEKYQYDFSKTVIILPNKRAIVFLLDALKRNSKKIFFAPKIIDIQEFFQEISQLKLIDNITLLFEFYNAYLQVQNSNKIQSFLEFTNWAKTALSDFNDIDNYLLDTNFVINYLKDIDRIKNWEVKPDISSKPKDYIIFWESLPNYYNKLKENLLNNNLGYSGLINREATYNINNYISLNNDLEFTFAGFNALNKCEEKIIKHLLSLNKATVYWDSDETFLNDYNHHASFHLRKIKQNWSYYNSNPFEWIFNNYSQEKNIQIISNSQNIGQAKITSNIIENLLKTKNDLSNTALILGNEDLLLPILNELPNLKNDINITMGYKSNLTNINHLILNIFKLHINALKRNKKNPIFYYKEVTAILSDSLIYSLLNNDSILNEIRQNNYTYFNFKTLLSLSDNNEIINEIFKVSEDISINEFIKNLIQLIKKIKLILENKEQKDLISISFLYSIYQSVLHLKNYANQENYEINTLEELFEFYKEVINFSEVSFEGKPLSGLQIMGMLETRLLDFDTIIITNLNEGFIPAGKSNNSFIPLDLRRDFSLPTFMEKDALLSYHFYRLISRAKNIYLIYNDDATGINSSEKSRFLSQIEINPQKNHTISKFQYYAPVPLEHNNIFKIEKDIYVLEAIKHHATQGFSPSSLAAYLRSRETFYTQYVLKIRQFDDVEENIANNTFGTIIHTILENLYKPYLNIELNEEILNTLLQKVPNETELVFKNIYKKGDLSKGKNLVSLKVAEEYINKYLELEKKSLITDTLKIISLEQSYECIIEDEKLPYPIKLKGKIDRIELRNSKIRIIDYKTGKVEISQLTINILDNLTSDIKNEKKIQLMCYLLMTKDIAEFKEYEIETGIIALKSLNKGFLPLHFKKDKVNSYSFTQEEIEAFKQELLILILEILDPNIPL